ncbi:hypothetical protein TWF694_001401 [Orbilia ellipsospora]|uniref:Uncharacterized protein n=1 Tax=Orbilia ellipsospora TaxID=2528407 RepID=A0AAV9XRJ1_9PEZI
MNSNNRSGTVNARGSPGDRAYCNVLTEVQGNSSCNYFQGNRHRPVGLPLHTELKVCGGISSESDMKEKKENIAPGNVDDGVDIEELIRRLTGQ